MDVLAFFLAAKNTFIAENLAFGNFPATQFKLITSTLKKKL